MAEHNENKMEEMIRTSLESIRAMVDANTVVGTPIETASGTTIIPISKISVGYAAGGTDSTTKKTNDGKVLFAGGGGTGLSVQPVCFIAVDALGNTEVLPLSSQGESDSIEKIAALIEKAPDIFARIKSVFPKKDKKIKKEKATREVAKAAADAVETITVTTEEETEA
ncbi:MAG: sporulation protein YtfJ [Clostridia bacterium]|nr:sporulation protein YtfJ [Clostridia bacterium]